ncbi:DUF4810 domain-containing protein [Dasania marina]|uniref:DUF4810 domain-containing protein n=1 Tax=Dasania marina TaxID=471499 RepID=UPI0003770D9F|nr:DUF4810 domain-containing protein [Dasania marina]
MITSSYKKLIIISITLLLFGCANNQGRWGNYSNELYTYYKSPTDEEKNELLAELVKIFKTAEKNGASPPPGLYAEYGTFLYERGDYPGAINYYTKEKNSWPDSTHYMNALINALSSQMQNNNKENS